MEPDEIESQAEPDTELEDDADYDDGLESADGDEGDGDEPAAPSPDPEPDPEPETALPSRRPTPPQLAAGQEEEYLRDNLDPQMYQAINALIENRVSQRTQAASYANVQMAVRAQEMPNLFRVHGPAIQSKLSQLAPQVQANPAAVDIAIAQLLIEEAQADGSNMAQALIRLAKLAGTTPPAKDAGRKAPTLSPSQRTPSISAAPSRASEPLSRTKAERDVDDMMKRYGLSRAEAREALRDERIR